MSAVKPAPQRPRRNWRAVRARIRRQAGFWPVAIAAVIGVAFLVGPSLIVAWQSVGTDKFVAFPPKGFTLDWYAAIDPALWRSLQLSVVLGLATTLIASLIAIPAALALVRSRMPGRGAVDTVLRLPLQLPYIVVGVAALQYYTLLDKSFSFGLRGSFVGLLVMHVAITAPFIIASAVSALQTFRVSYEEAAFSLGMSRFRTLFAVTLPIIRPSLFAGAFFAFLVSFENVPVSMFLNVAGQNTMPVAVYLAAEVNNSPSLYAFSTVITVASALLILGMQRFVSLRSSTRVAGA